MTTPAERREIIDAVRAGAIPMSALSDVERQAVNAEIDASIREHVRAIDVGAVLRERGVKIVTLDDDGNLVEQPPETST